jgi:CTP-dependent riboflavin kinase
MIEGMVASGSGKASQAFSAARMDEVRTAFGWTPFPGTLNLTVPDLPATLAGLPEPVMFTEHDTPIGPLQWWRIWIRSPLWAGPWHAALVRGRGSAARFLEIVAPVELRAVGLKNGDVVTVEVGGRDV